MHGDAVGGMVHSSRWCVLIVAAVAGAVVTRGML